MTAARKISPLTRMATFMPATRMGIQVCDQNGRVRAILPLPTPCGPLRSLCFGGEHFRRALRHGWHAGL